MRREYSIRLARAGDAGPIAAISREQIESGLSWSWTPGRVRAGIRDPETVAVVAEKSASLRGFALMQFGDRSAHLNLLGVVPEWRRFGVGTALLRWLEESAVVAGIPMIRLEVRRSNQPAQRFYRRLGYAAVAMLPNYYKGREHAVRMTRDLRVGASSSSD